MRSAHQNGSDLALASLEALASSARSGFACMFSTADEYEAALIDERRAEGRYRRPSRLPMIAFWVCALGIACVVLIAG